MMCRIMVSVIIILVSADLSAMGLDEIEDTVYDQFERFIFFDVRAPYVRDVMRAQVQAGELSFSDENDFDKIPEEAEKIALQESIAICERKHDTAHKRCGCTLPVLSKSLAVAFFLFIPSLVPKMMFWLRNSYC